jgi:hypothetical protein
MSGIRPSPAPAPKPRPVATPTNDPTPAAKDQTPAAKGKTSGAKGNTASAKNTPAVRPTPNPRPGPVPTGPVTVPTAATLAADLAKQIRNEVKEFRAGQTSWSSLDRLRRQAAALKPNQIADPALNSTLRAASEQIEQQGRSLGDNDGGDAVKLLKSSILDAQAGRIGHPELTRTLELVKTSRERHQNHWEPGAIANVVQLEEAARTKTLPLLSGRDERVARELTEAQRTWQRSASQADLNALLKKRDAASELLSDNLADPARSPALGVAVRSADMALARARVKQVDAALTDALKTGQVFMSSAERDKLNNTLAEATSVRRVAGLPPTPAMFEARTALLSVPSAPRVGAVRFSDIDPDGDGKLGATYVGVQNTDGSVVQTRVRMRETHVGEGKWERDYEAQGVFWRSADGKSISERPGRTYLLRAEDGSRIQHPDKAKEQAQAVERAQTLIKNGAITTSDAKPGAAASTTYSVTDPRNDGRFESEKVMLTKGVGQLGNRNLSELRGLLERNIAPHAQRYLDSSNTLIERNGTDLVKYFGTDLENTVGVSMNLAPNRVPVPGGGPQSLYSGEAAAAIAPVADALRRAGGDAPSVRPLPVYLRVSDTQMAHVPLFRVKGGDGYERLVDNVGSTYESFDDWKRSNQLGAVDVFVPSGGRMKAEGGRVQFEAFDNRRFDNAALPVIKGGVYAVGATLGVVSLVPTGGTSSPIVAGVLGGVSAFSFFDGAATLTDMARHGESLSLGNPKARTAVLDTFAGALGGFSAIRTGSKALGLASGGADVLQLGNAGHQLATDFSKMSAGDRALAGAQMMFWLAMSGKSLGRGAHSRYDYDALGRAMTAPPANSSPRTNDRVSNGIQPFKRPPESNAIKRFNPPDTADPVLAGRGAPNKPLTPDQVFPPPPRTKQAVSSVGNSGDASPPVNPPRVPDKLPAVNPTGTGPTSMTGAPGNAAPNSGETPNTTNTPLQPDSPIVPRAADGSGSQITPTPSPAAPSVDRNAGVISPQSAPDGVNAYGFVNLIGGVQSAAGTRSVPQVPALDPGSGYVGIVSSPPDGPVRIAWTPGFGAQINGRPAPDQASKRSTPHAEQLKRFFDKQDPQFHAGFYAEYLPDGKVLLTAKSGQLNATLTRIGEHTFRRAGYMDAEFGPSTYYFTDPRALDTLAQLVANGTGRTVVIGPHVDPSLSSRIGTEVTPEAPQPSLTYLPLTAAQKVHTVPGVGFSPSENQAKVFSAQMHVTTIQLAPLVRSGRVDGDQLWQLLTESRAAIARGLDASNADYFALDRMGGKWREAGYGDRQIVTYLQGDPRYQPWIARLPSMAPSDPRSPLESGGTLIETVDDEQIRLTTYESSGSRGSSTPWARIRSPTPSELPVIWAKVEPLMQRALSAGGDDEALRHLAEAHWWMAHACRNARGSAAVADAWVRTVAAARGMSLSEWNTVPDLEALFSTRQDFVRRYPSMFAAR